MCGFTGFFGLTAELPPAGAEHLVRRMSDVVMPRGPDDGQTRADSGACFVLGFRLHAICVLIPAGRQPMVSANDRYAIVFSGEVNSADDLRPELAARGVGCRAHSDA